MFVLQDPNDAASNYLDEELIARSVGAQSGFAVFAFASARGIALLFDDAQFEAFVAAHAFELVVGIAAITDSRALRKLRDIADKHPSFSPRVFIPLTNEALFHPKFCYFQAAAEGRLIVGSGNLTSGGLRNNWEAFTTQQVLDRSVQEIWDRWKAGNTDRMFEVSDPRVAQVVEQQEAAARAVAAALKAAGFKPRGKERRVQADSNEQLVLVAEIPRAGNRWNQANFDVATFTDYFGAKLGSTQRVHFTNVNAAGVLGDVESRPSVSVVSQNYRFELHAAQGLDYPAEGRPIGLFLKLAKREFVYLLSMPGEPSHEPLVRMLDSRRRSGQFMRRERFSVKELRAFWPNSPVLGVEVQSDE